jgi:uncharacterized membrane protein
MQLRFLIYISFLFLIVISCTKSSNEGNNNGGSNTGGCSGTPGTKFTAVKAVLANNCALSGCHSGAAPQNGINFTDNCTIVAQAARIKLRAVDQAGTPNQMPPPPNLPLSTADRQKITDWVAAGGKLTD